MLNLPSVCAQCRLRAGNSPRTKRTQHCTVPPVPSLAVRWALAARCCAGATTTPRASAPSSPGCAPQHEDRRDGRLLFQRFKIAPTNVFWPQSCASTFFASMGFMVHMPYRRSQPKHSRASTRLAVHSCRRIFSAPPVPTARPTRAQSP